MLKPRTVLLVFAVIFSFGWLSSFRPWKSNSADLPVKSYKTQVQVNYSTGKTKEKAVEARKFISQNSFNHSTCFLVDMNIPSGQNRFFVYDLEKDSVQSSGLVTHGRCNQNWMEGRKYGNTVGCGCTSLGKYRIGNSYIGRFGLAFKLYGLDNTNNQAFNRFVVLHSHTCVPEAEVKNDICQSDGCPTVSPGFLLQLKSIIKGSRKPVLLWIYQ